MIHVTCRLTAKNRGLSSGTIRSVIEYGLATFAFFLLCSGCFAVQMTSVLQIVAAATVLATTERPGSKHLLQAPRDIDHRHAVLSKLTYPRSCSGPTFTPPLSELIRLCIHRVAVT